ncbi:UPF0182 family protein [Desulforamulus hydrothermalis]|uniref:UPF0182 protein DESHY_110052 n=1 Tax=Desulforamulus hydrothermalis Lam5 = DSM 18033 TaxID=1121428 RepID=K8E6K0_9FIRM|nr:UPF0182 family protein [Desulforamulus hydrothermalis]CCO07108.1 conserved membrane hypothetical protein [Desulforamulus hydrothermalis Lam5 = DSM 18033]SHG89990.1 hypothetical protein SAMN02745177_00766 [Desulforamulus hydrothermalis Lam5 = DSM 18033]
MQRGSRFSLGLFILLTVFVFSLVNWGTGLYVDWLWFSALHYPQVFITKLLSEIGLRAAIGFFMFLFLMVNLLLTRKSVLQAIKSAKPFRPVFPDDDVITINQPSYDSWREQITPGRLTAIFAVISLVLGFLYSATVTGQWTTVLKFVQQTAFGVADPIFNKDIGFYIFSLPFYELIYRLLASAIFINILLVALVYLVTDTARGGLTKIFRFPAARYHLSALAALFFILKSWGYWLNRFGLLYSTGGVVHGAGYTDIHATLLAYQVLSVISLITALVIIANIFLNKFRLTAYAIGGLLLASVVLGGLYPAVIQKFVVLPNEFNREAPYIANNIKLTQQAYQLDTIEQRDFPAGRTLQPKDIQENRNTVENIRLWDWQPLQQTYSQLQEMRLYYEFKSIDIDRYEIGGRYRQVMLAVREMNQEQLPQQAKTWINQRLKYTHGYGIAMSPVNEVSGEGLPQFFLKDIPPVPATDIKVTRPEIYYGESDDGYVIVNTKTEEFDYPKGDGNAYSKYEGSGGVRVNSFLRKLLFAINFADYKLLLTGDITNDSQVLFYRNIKERVPKIAPFLSYDSDPYPVINQKGEIIWLWDAYTVSDRYPYSEPFDNRGNNYIRNSVKVTVNAYNGEVNFYIADTRDPILQTYSKIFPSMFKSLAQMPADLRDHIRYPEDLFLVQCRMYTLYHMTDPQVFYNREDKWTLPTEKVGTEEKPMEPYYTITVLPGEQKPEYILIMPFNPQNKKNMIAWLAARSDGENYGKMVVYEFPKQELVYGPMQIEARIDQDTTISQQLTLWDQRGSSVLRGNLLIIPIKDSLLYVEPLYLQSEQSKMPELRRVIVAHGEKIVMEPTLELALQRIFGEGAALPTPIKQGAPPQTGQTGQEQPAPQATIKELAVEANRLYEEAQTKLKNGDWAGYGQSLNALKEVLNKLQDQTNP